MRILITGATSGIGYLTALTLAERGHFVYLTCHTQKQVLNVKEKVSDYENIKVLKVDITKADDRKKVLELDVDVLYSNAAAGISGSILEHNITEVRKVFEINVFSNFLLVRDVLRKMIEKDFGRIVMMSSLAGEVTIPFLGVYSATKASINSLVRSLKLELKTLDTRVDIALVEPGLYHTGFNNYVIDSKYNDDKYFKDVKDILYNLEHAFLFLTEKNDLDSIVIQIVRAVEDKKLKKVYKAPFLQSWLVKVLSLFK